MLNVSIQVQPKRWWKVYSQISIPSHLLSLKPISSNIRIKIIKKCNILKKASYLGNARSNSKNIDLKIKMPSHGIFLSFKKNTEYNIMSHITNEPVRKNSKLYKSKIMINYSKALLGGNG